MIQSITFVILSSCLIQFATITNCEKLSQEKQDAIGNFDAQLNKPSEITAQKSPLDTSPVTNTTPKSNSAYIQDLINKGKKALENQQVQELLKKGSDSLISAYLANSGSSAKQTPPENGIPATTPSSTQDFLAKSRKAVENVAIQEFLNKGRDSLMSALTGKSAQEVTTQSAKLDFAALLSKGQKLLSAASS